MNKQKKSCLGHYSILEIKLGVLFYIWAQLPVLHDLLCAELLCCGLASRKNRSSTYCICSRGLCTSGAVPQPVQSHSAVDGSTSIAYNWNRLALPPNWSRAGLNTDLVEFRGFETILMNITFHFFPVCFSRCHKILHTAHLRVYVWFC